jgi:thiosulfate/3-mercaptopyruvate sulfurtransferase
MRLSLSGKIFAVLAIATAAPARAQCGPPDEQGPPVRDSLLVSAHWLSEHLRDSNLVILHVDHMSDGYARAHIPGARKLDAMAFTVNDFDLPPLARIDSIAESLGIGPATRVVIYGDPWVTGIVFVALDQLGHGNRTALLDGGLEQWRAEGLPLTAQVAPATHRAYAPHPKPGVVVDAAWMRAHLATAGITIIDARTADEYAGAPGRDPTHGGHIAGAVSLPWSQTFEHPADAEQSRGSRLKPAGELRALFSRVGVHAGVTPVVYCTVGMRASHMYFVLRYLGYDPKFYDGSITDWVRRNGNPVVTGNARGTP